MDTPRSEVQPTNDAKAGWHDEYFSSPHPWIDKWNVHSCVRSLTSTEQTSLITSLVIGKNCTSNISCTKLCMFAKMVGMCVATRVGLLFKFHVKDVNCQHVLMKVLGMSPVPEHKLVQQPASAEAAPPLTNCSRYKSVREAFD
eukprot:TRINITY_DN57531_c0_g1_i1.p2 TRINITY_DN57531_c0_g1~~TRINITY_DN57531_c0_g1_i1.p2  ORF type:complete len:143 (-),score=21.46 TRINITY_DN57531_c0_g1_i1:498-926(-)